MRYPLGKDPADIRQSRKQLLDLCSHRLYLLHRFALHLEAEGRLDARQLHVQAVFYRHSPGIRQPRELQLGIHLGKQLFVGYSWPPPSPGFQHDGGVVHVERRVVGRAVGPAHSAEHALHFRKRSQYTILGSESLARSVIDFWEVAQDAVLFLQERGGLRDANTRQRRWHIERRALKQGRHELAAQGESQGNGDNQKDYVNHDDQPTMAQRETNHRQIDRLRQSRDRIFRFRPEPAFDEHQHQDGDKRDRQHRRESHGNGLGPGQRPEHATFLRFEQKHREERNDDD